MTSDNIRPNTSPEIDVSDFSKIAAGVGDSISMDEVSTPKGTASSPQTPPKNDEKEEPETPNEQENSEASLRVNPTDGKEITDKDKDKDKDEENRAQYPNGYGGHGGYGGGRGGGATLKGILSIAAKGVHGLGAGVGAGFEYTGKALDNLTSGFGSRVIDKQWKDFATYLDSSETAVSEAHKAWDEFHLKYKKHIDFVDSAMDSPAMTKAYPDPAVRRKVIVEQYINNNTDAKKIFDGEEFKTDLANVETKIKDAGNTLGKLNEHNKTLENMHPKLSPEKVSERVKGLSEMFDSVGTGENSLMNKIKNVPRANPEELKKVSEMFESLSKAMKETMSNLSNVISTLLSALKLK